jgi:hypothetical protein
MIPRRSGRSSVSEPAHKIKAERQEETTMRYYIIVNHKRIYFEFSYAGLRAVQKYLLDNGISSRMLHTCK